MSGKFERIGPLRNSMTAPLVQLTWADVVFEEVYNGCLDQWEIHVFYLNEQNETELNAVIRSKINGADHCLNFNRCHRRLKNTESVFLDTDGDKLFLTINGVEVECVVVSVLDISVFEQWFWQKKPRGAYL